jgi:hypothetical protein
VVFASTVELEDLWSRATPSAYQIVGDDEADIDHGLISVSSPIARADRQERRRRRGPCRRRAACANTSHLGQLHLKRGNVMPHRVFRLLSAVWVGSLLTIGHAVAPVLFRTRRSG